MPKSMVSGLAALAAVAALGACSTTGTKEASPSSAPVSTQSSTPTSASVQASAHNQADVDFATMMIPHHQQAIEMSDIVLAKQGIDPRVVDLATKIKAAQGPEISTMQGWLDQWGSPMPSMSDMPGMDHGGMHGGMDGMMSSAEMDALENAEGVEADRLFLSGMVKHHQGALTMAQDEIKNGQSAEAIALATSILESQQKEIDTMNQILSSL